MLCFFPPDTGNQNLTQFFQMLQEFLSRLNLFNAWSEPVSVWPEEFVQGLRYLDTLRREGDKWRFVYRKVMVDYAYKQPAWFDFTDPLLAGKRPGRFGDGDPSYTDLKHPAFARGARK